MNDFRIYFEPREDSTDLWGRCDPPLGWDEVEASLAGEHHMAKPLRKPPKDVPPVDCPRCGQPMQALYWANSDACWAGLCGRAGWIRYCLPCKGWTTLLGDFIMN